MTLLRIIKGFESLKIVTTGLCLCSVLLCGGCQQVERAAHEGVRLVHEKLITVVPVTASGEVVTERGAHKITIAGVRGSRAHGETLYEVEQMALYKLHKTSGERIEVKIENSELAVNGKKYGVLRKGDSITVDGDKVLINERVALEIASR